MADDTKSQSEPVSFIDDPMAPQIFATAIAGLWQYQGNVQITLESACIDHSTNPGPINRVVTGRVIMSIEAAQSLAAQLYSFLKETGHDPVPRMPGDHLQ